MNNVKKPELLAPAGDLEKLMAAVAFGADAVYVGGNRFGLRAKAKNLDLDEMERGISYAHEYGRKVYVTANIIPHDDDFHGMADYFRQISRLGADGVIVSDPGVFALALETAPELDIHISTQAGVTSGPSALFWHKMGAKRVILARELSAKEVKGVTTALPDGFEAEVFVHGAMCVSFSGRCLLSAYMTGRDANLGECAHPCRWRYSLAEETRPGEYMPVYEDDGGTYILNSKDLCLIERIPALVNAGAASLKIEGRMKSAHYVAATVDAYRRAIDDYFEDPDVYEARKAAYLWDVSKASHRRFTTGFFAQDVGGTQIYETSAYERPWVFLGIVLDYDAQTQIATVAQRNKFSLGDTAEILRSGAPPYAQTISHMTGESGEPLESAPHPGQIVRMKVDQPVSRFDMLRTFSNG